MIKINEQTETCEKTENQLLFRSFFFLPNLFISHFFLNKK